MNAKQLEDYCLAWTEHDIDKIMSYMTDDCVFDTGGGAEACGTRYEGAAIVRERFIAVWTDVPDVRFDNHRHFVMGDRGCSQWTIVGTFQDGTKMDMDGCDLFTFVGDKIRIKSSYLKIRSS